MATVVFTLMTVTPYRLRYLMQRTNVQGGDIVATGVLPNAGGASPDLRTDSALWRGYPLNTLMNRFCPNLAVARRLLLGDLTGTTADTELIRAHTKLTPRSSPDPAIGAPQWAVDANEGVAAGSPASANHAVFVVSGPVEPLPDSDQPICYLDVYFQHTDDL